MNRKYTKENLEPHVLSSISYAEVLRKLGIRPTGENYVNLQRNIDKFGIDSSHMLNQAVNRGKEFVKFEELTSKTAIKKRLLIKRGHKCEGCMNTHWLGKPITIELEHTDGDNRNNAESNLKLLCPNCHSQTPTWKNKKR